MPSTRTMDHAVLGLLGLTSVAVPIGAILHFLFPMTTRRLWVDTVDFVFGFVFWAINPITFGIVFYGGIGLLILGIVVIVWNRIRSVFA